MIDLYDSLSLLSLQLNLKHTWFFSRQPSLLPASSVVMHSENISYILRDQNFCWTPQLSHTRHTDTDRDTQHAADRRAQGQTYTATITTYKGRTNTHSSYDTHIHKQPDTICTHRHILHIQTPTETHTQLHKQISLTKTKLADIHMDRHRDKQIHKTDQVGTDSIHATQCWRVEDTRNMKNIIQIWSCSWLNVSKGEVLFFLSLM